MHRSRCVSQGGRGVGGLTHLSRNFRLANSFIGFTVERKVNFVKTASRSWFTKTSTVVIGRQRKHQTIRYIIGSHVQSAVSCQLNGMICASSEHYGESVGALVTELQCIPLLGNLWSAAVQKLPLTTWLFYVPWLVWHLRLPCDIHEACYCDMRYLSFPRMYL
jgi:hypothetical protein